MEKYKTLFHDKSDFKDLETYLVRNELIDERRIWFAGFPYTDGAEQNAVAGNLFYGNKRLKIISVKEEDIYFFHNDGNEFSIYILGKVNDKKHVRVRMRLLHPIIDFEFANDKPRSLQINKNKAKLKDFKKL